MIKRKQIVITIAVLLAVAIVPALAGIEKVHAGNETAIATISWDGGKRSCTYFSELVLQVKEHDDETIRITMETDWNDAGARAFKEPLVIPEKCNATLDMNGHVFNRNNAWDKGDDCYDGELIYISEDATLTINGGNKNVKHPLVPVHKSTTKDSLATGRETFYGGLLCGGASDDGPGGIYMDSDSTLILNDVTIAGCRAHKGFWSSEDGDGGAIQMDGADIKVVLNNSRITGCLASDRGGAIYADYTATLYCSDIIEMHNSSIDHNYSTNNGGGIFLNLDNTTVTGGGDTSISYNESGGSGGGIIVNDEDISISGFTMEGNKAKKNGGAIYTDNTDLKLTKITAKNNKAERGGGFYINKDKVTMTQCEITGNKADLSGGGVYLGENVNTKIGVTGKTIVRGNTIGSGFGPNFYMSDSDPEDNRVNFDLSSGADVRVCYFKTNDKDRIMVTQGKNSDTIKSPDCTRFLTSENKGYYFTFLPEASNRKIILKKGTKPETPAPKKISADEASPEKVGNVTDGGKVGFHYDLYRGYFTHQKTDATAEDKNGVFYYSDAFFYGGNDPQYKYNEHLATTSLALAFSAMYSGRSADSINGSTYYNKHADGRQFLADIGCNEQYIYVNDYNVQKPDTDSIGVIIGKRNLQKHYAIDGKDVLADTGDILIPVAVRGGGYELEWASNVTLGSAEQTKDRGKEAKGFSDAAEEVTKEVNKYLDKYNLRDDYEKGNVKFWVVGYSRAGATANLTSKRLVEQIEKDCKGTKKSQVFGYTCEAPKGGTDDAEKLDASKYYCIHNMINKADLVPYVAPENMGFKRYGVDHYIPGSAAGSVTASEKTITRGGAGGVTKVTTRSDNKSLRTKGAKENDAESKSYNTQRNKMVKQLAMIDSAIVFDDYFHPMYIDFPSVEFYETGSYDNTRVEEFLEDFIRFFTEGLEPKEAVHWSQAICHRDRWVEPWGMNGKYYSTMENALRDLMILSNSKSPEEFGTFTDRAVTAKDKIPTILHSGVTQFQLYTDVIGDWNELNPAEKEKWCTYFWNLVDDAGALEFLTKDERDKLQKDWPTLLNVVLHLVDGDYQYSSSSKRKNAVKPDWMSGQTKTMMYVGTLATFASYIAANHYPEVNLAWARTYDWYYSGEFDGYPGFNPGETDEYVITAPKSVDAPSAYVVVEEKTETGETKKTSKELEYKGAGNVNELSGDQKIYLDNKEIRGEAIYYDVYELKNGKAGRHFEANKIYRGGIDLSGELTDEQSFRIITYDMSRGVSSSKATYDVLLRNDRHRIVVVNPDGSGPNKKEEFWFDDDQEASIQAEEPDDKYFGNWTVRILNQDGSEKPGQGDEAARWTRVMKTADPAAASQVFSLPAVDDDFFGKGYGLEFTANYRDRIKTIDTKFAAPNSGADVTELPADATVQFDRGTGEPKAETYAISWTGTYDDESGSKTVPESGVIFKDTKYTAAIQIPQDKANGYVFVPNPKLTACDADGNAYAEDLVLAGSITRNDADGSVTVILEFKETTAGENRFETDGVLTAEARDLNTGEIIPDTLVEYPITWNGQEPAVITVTAQDVEAEVFTQWDLKTETTGIEIVSGEVTDKTIQISVPRPGADETPSIVAQYTPVINEVTVSLDQPQGGEPMQMTAKSDTLKVRIEKEYEVDPDFVGIEWSPSPSKDSSGVDRAGYVIEYTARVTLKPLEDENGRYIRVREAGTQDYSRINAIYRFAEYPVTTVNGEAATCNPDFNLVKYRFPYTKYRFDHFETWQKDITDLKHGSGENEIRKLLVDRVDAYTTNGRAFRADVSWEITKDDPDADPRAESVWTATGTVQMPSLMENPDGKSTTLTVKAYVNGAASAEAPRASVASGTYLNDQVVTLSADEKDGTIYYAVYTENPPKSEDAYAEWEKNLDWKEYTGENIYISRYDAERDEDHFKKIHLKAYTKCDGKWDSTVATYSYVFDNEIPVPTCKDLEYNGQKQVGFYASQLYSLEALSGDEEHPGAHGELNGDITATNAGTYRVRAELIDQYTKWILPQDEESGDAAEKKTTTENQIVTFTIRTIPIRYADISGIEDKTYTGEPVTQTPKLTITIKDKKVTLKEGKDYELSYENNNAPGTATVIINGKGNYSASVSLPFEIKEGDIPVPVDTTHKVLLVDGDQTSVYQYAEGDAVTILAREPADQYFKHWKADLLDGDGAVKEENIEGCILDIDGEPFLDEHPSTGFKMPAAEVDKYDLFHTYPEGYVLRFTAVYADRITKITSSPTAPKAGVNLAEKASVSFDGREYTKEYPISWTYSYEEDGKTITVLTSGEAYKDTIYTATIAVPQDQASDIVFAPTGSLTGVCETGTVTRVKRNDADGSASITIEFPKTGRDGGSVRPDVNISLTVMSKDLSITAEGYDGDAAAEYQVHQGDTITLIAPDVENKQFVGWDFGSSGISLESEYLESDRIVRVKIPARLSGNPLKIYAEYEPVISAIDISLRQPVAGEVMQTAAEAGTMKAIIAKQYEIDPDCIAIAWSPEPGEGNKAAYQTAYTATVSITTYEDETGAYIMVKGPGDSDYATKLAARFLYADDLTVKVNGSIAVCDEAANSVHYTFPKTESEPIDPRHKVIVADGAQTSVYQYEPGEAVTVVAHAPSEKYFKNWNVSLLSSEGEVIKEDISDKISGIEGEPFVPLHSTASFTMPAVGADFPEDYSLQFTAVYGDRISEITASLTAPKAGADLADRAAVAFDSVEVTADYPVSWTYSYQEDGETVTVPTSGQAFRDTVYTATITIPQQQADGIMFVSSDALTGHCATGTVKSVKRDDADGSARLVIEFDKTEKTGPVRPDVDIDLTVMGYDLNKKAQKDYDGEIVGHYQVLQGSTLSLTAPEVPNETFVKWDFGDTGIRLAGESGVRDKTVQVRMPTDFSEESLKIYAMYTPALSEIRVSLDQPVAGQPMQTEAKAGALLVTVSNQYEIDPDFVDIAWTPEPLTEDGVKTADNSTSYTATVSIRTKKDGSGKYILAKRPGEEGYAIRLSAEFTYADELQVFVNDDAAACDTVNGSVSYTFPETEKAPDPVLHAHKVTVNNGSGAEPREYQYKENETVTVTANPPAHKYFRNWSVKLLDAAGETAEEDIAEELLGDSIGSATAKFVLPEEGQKIKDGLLGLLSSDKYPEGYSLEITANCADRIKQITTSPTAPTSGEELAEKATVAFDNGAQGQEYLIKWTYSYEKDGKTVVVPASGKAFRDTAYTATITVPQDQEKDILFANELSLVSSYEAGVITGSSVTKDSTDGSAKIVIAFAKTGSSEGPIRPDVPLSLTVKVKDLNLGTYDDGAAVTYRVKRNPDQDAVITLTAPDVDSEQFRQWNFGETGIAAAEGYDLEDKALQAVIPADAIAGVESLTIEAQYIPVVSEITAKLETPAGGKVMQTAAGEGTLKVKIANTYEVKPECVRIAWSPKVSTGGTAAYRTAYTATLTIQPEEGKDYIEVRKSGETDYTRISAMFAYGENLKAVVNGEPAVCDSNTGSLRYTFPATGEEPGADKHTLTVYDGDRVSIEQYQEGDAVTILTKPTSDQYFRSWTVRLLNEGGSEAAADIAGALLEDPQKSAARFVMPAAGTDEYSVGHFYPEGYALEITADYGEKIKMIQTAPAAPEAGSVLAETATASFDNDAAPQDYPITWTYTYEKDGKTIVVPASGAVFRDTAYTATINIPQDRASDIVFADEIKLESGYGEGIVTDSSAVKNNADGSASIVIGFAKTAADAGPVRPDVPIELTVRVKDLDLGTYDDNAAAIYHLKRDADQDSVITLTAQDLGGKQFQQWYLGETGLVPAEGYDLIDKTIQIIVPTEVSMSADKLVIEAQYIPVVNRISAYVDEPVAAQDMQTSADETTLQVMITNQYEIDPEFISIRWTPEPVETDGHRQAVGGIAYTAAIGIEPKEDADGKYIRVKGPDDTAYKRLSAQWFAYSESLKATVNDKAVVCDTYSNSISYTFPKTDTSHKVSVTDGEQTTVKQYQEGDTVNLEASIPEGRIFKGWSIVMLDGDGQLNAENMEDTLIPETGANVSASFTLPAAGTPMGAAGKKYPNAYALDATANYIDRIKKITASVDAPMTGVELDEKARVSFDNGAPAQDHLISWTFSSGEDGETIPVSDIDRKAAAETTYTATINVPKDPEKDVLFVASESLKGICETGTVKSITRNDTDGSATIVIEFEKTGPKPSDEEVDAVIDLIRKLPDPSNITLKDKADVAKAREAYDKLTDEQKQQIPQDLVKKLIDAEKAIAYWDAYYKEVDAVIDLIRKLPDPSDITSKDKADVAKAREAYDKLTDEQKQLIPQDLVKKLIDAEKAIADWDAYYKEVDAVIDLIRKLPDPSKITSKDKADVAKARKAYDKLTDEQKQLIPQDLVKKLTNAEKAVAGWDAYNKKAAAAGRIKVKLTSAAPGAYKKAVIKWKKRTGISGYQIRYSTYKKFKKGVKKVSVKKAKTKKKTISKLAVGKTYYVQVRAFTKIRNQATGKTTTVYGKWSNKKKFVAMQKAKITSAKAKKGRKAVIKWKKCKGVTGYQIRYSTSKKFKKSVKKVKVKKAKTKKKTISKLKAGKTYYVQVRTYKKFKKKTVYGKWSKTRKCKAKK